MNKRILSISVLAIVAVLILGACSAWPPVPVSYGPGNMMGGGGMMGNSGMMGYGYSQTGPIVQPTPIGATSVPADREIQISAASFRFTPDRIAVKPGETVRFVITNQDNALHNFVVQDTGLPYLPLPAGTTQSVVWTAPTKVSTYTALCTLHAGMSLAIVVGN